MNLKENNPVHTQEYYKIFFDNGEQRIRRKFKETHKQTHGI